MDNVMQTRVASVLTVVVGAWLLISPLFISITGAALVSTLIVGAIVVVAGAVQAFWESTFPSWVSGLAALWMAISTISFGMSGALLWSTLVAAAATFLLAVWDGIEVDQVAQRHQVSI